MLTEFSTFSKFSMLFFGTASPRVPLWRLSFLGKRKKAYDTKGYRKGGETKGFLPAHTAKARECSARARLYTIHLGCRPRPAREAILRACCLHSRVALGILALLFLVVLSLLFSLSLLLSLLWRRLS